MSGDLGISLNNLFLNAPLLGYSALAAGFLLVVSLLSGLGRFDFLALASGRTLLFLGLGATTALFIYLLGTSPTQILPPDVPQGRVTEGLSRLPLFLLALAYGPSVGVLGGLLFAGLLLSLTGQAPLIFGLLIMIELAVLGWLALAPSVFKWRWAGPFNVLAALLLSWATAGTAVLFLLELDAASFAAHWQYHKLTLAGLSPLLLLWLPPSIYRRTFVGSRVPGAAAISGLSERKASDRGAPELTGNLEGDRRLGTVDIPPVGERRKRRRSRSLEPVYIREELRRASA